MPETWQGQFAALMVAVAFVACALAAVSVVGPPQYHDEPFTWRAIKALLRWRNRRRP